MDKKVESKSGKKRYSKPQITRVKLAMTTATLGDCWTSTFIGPIGGACQISGCAQ